ncbi:MAG: MerR family transcriptional regulator [Moraxella sp.]|nr:MerR family transcriptional regulator [Moraxella sp.]
MQKTYHIKEVSDITGISSETLRYYEKEGLIAKPARAANGYRLYNESQLASLRFIKTCRSLGFDLKSIESLNQLRLLPEQDCANADEIAAVHLADVRAKIGQLMEIEQFLVGLGDCNEHQSAKCKVLSTLGDMQ